MASTYSNLKIELMTTGENDNTWGNVTNINLGTALEEAIAGSVDVAFNNGNETLELIDTNGTQKARNLRLNLTGDTSGTPAGYFLYLGAGANIEKPYIVRNGTNNTVRVVNYDGANPTGANISIPAGKTMWVYNTGSSIVDAVTHLTSLTLGTPLDVNQGGTGTNSNFTAGSIVFASSANVFGEDKENLFWDNTNNYLGIGTNVPGYALTVDGATIGVKRYAAGANINLLRAAGTKTAPAANGDAVGLGGIFVQSYDGANYQNSAYIRFFTNGATTASSSAAGIQFQTTSLNATSVTTKMTLSSEGDLTVTGNVSANALSLTTGLNVASGGTGVNTITSGAVIIGAGTSPVTSVAPGTSGNILTSNGTAWVSQAIGGGGSGVSSITGTANQVIASSSTGAVTLSLPQSINTTSNVRFASLGVNTAASGTAGEIRATNNITAFFSSDARFKENIEDIQGALDAVCAIGGKIFDWSDQYIKEHGGEDGYFVRKRDFGMIAQDVMKNFPLGARARPDETLAVDYEKMCALAFQAIKELRAEVEALKNGAK